MKTLVVYYSRKGSNKYLANKIASDLQCDIEEIRPRINIFLFFLMNIHLGIKSLHYDLKEYDRIILCGPIWVGRFIAPLKSFVKRYSKNINKLIFVTCCGSEFSKKDEQFGHGLVFIEVKKILKEKCIHCEAFPIALVIPKDKMDDDTITMKTHLNDSNFTGEILNLYRKFIERIKEFEVR